MLAGDAPTELPVEGGTASGSSTDFGEIDLAAPDVADNMTHLQVGDGDTTDISVGGRVARRNVDPNEDFYFYFDVAESCFALSSESIFWVTSSRRTSIHWWT